MFCATTAPSHATTNTTPCSGQCLAKSQTSGEANKEAVNHPSHYTQHPSGVECIDITEHMNFCLGNAVKYIWRAGLKGDEIEDLRKARWYLEREIERRSR